MALFRTLNGKPGLGFREAVSGQRRFSTEPVIALASGAFQLQYQPVRVQLNILALRDVQLRPGRASPTQAPTTYPRGTPVSRSPACPQRDNRGMRKFLAVAGSAVFFILAPGTVAGWAPWWISRGSTPTAEPAWPFRSLGFALVAAGVTILLDSFARFALQGLGTPAPVFPTRHLVITGLYRYVRNPIYVAVVAVILGQSLCRGSVAVVEYGAVVWLAFHLFELVYEEPTLRAKYGAEYDRFCRAVPRWIPLLRPASLLN